MKPRPLILCSLLMGCSALLAGVHVTNRSNGSNVTQPASEEEQKEAFNLVRNALEAIRQSNAPRFHAAWNKLPAGDEAERISRIFSAFDGTSYELTECVRHKTRPQWHVIVWTESAGLIDFEVLRQNQQFKINTVKEL